MATALERFKDFDNTECNIHLTHNGGNNNNNNDMMIERKKLVKFHRLYKINANLRIPFRRSNLSLLSIPYLSKHFLILYKIIVEEKEESDRDESCICGNTDVPQFHPFQKEHWTIRCGLEMVELSLSSFHQPE